MTDVQERPAEPRTSDPPQVDGDKLMGFVLRAVDEVGAMLNAALVVMGDRLGYYRELKDTGPTTPSRLARATGTTEPCAREWLNAQAAGGFVEYDPVTGRYTLAPEHAVALTDEASPAYLPGFFQIALGAAQDAWELVGPVKDGAGLKWREHHHEAHEGCGRFLRPGYLANLADGWLPTLDGVVPALERGIKVADIGCGHGASTILMAQAFPRSTFVGSDHRAEPIAEARQRAEAAGVADRVTFEVATAQEFSGTGYDLVTTFDALHDRRAYDGCSGSFTRFAKVTETPFNQVLEVRP